MAVAIENARNLTHGAATLRDAGQPIRAPAAMAKLYASEIVVTAAREAVQIHGSYGFMEESPVARHYRDAKILEIGEGTSEIQRIIIARGLGPSV
jgi:short/branched chain acyl-CoA dehydrogenase